MQKTKILDMLLPNLQHGINHIRLFTLQTLQYFPIKHLIFNHDSLDLRDNLDEEYASLNNNT